MKRLWTIAAAALLLGVVVVAPPVKRVAAATTGWTTYHHDNSRNGYDPSAPTYVGGPYSSWTKSVDAEVYAEPLAFNGRVYVATMGDSVYSFDAVTGNPVWAKTGLGIPRAGFCSWGATTGIMSTPVIDPATSILYAVGLDDAATGIRYRMWGLNLSDGSNAPGFPVTVGPSPQDQNQRAALALANGHVYAAFGGWIGDCGTYHPYVISVPATGGAQDHAYQPQTGCQNAAGIWGPSGISVDGSGNLFVTTGNGNGCYGGGPPCNNSLWDHGDAVIKLSSTLAELDYWAPDNATQSWCSLHNTDTDIGSIGPALLPNNTIFQTGKSGYGWLLNSTSFGAHFDTQQFQGLVHSNCRVFGGVAFYNNRLYVPCDGTGLVAFSVDTVAHTFNTTPDWVQPVNPGAPIAAMGLIWVRGQGGNNLYGFDPANGTTRVQINLGFAASLHFPSIAEDGGWVFVPHGANINAYNFNPPTCSSTTSPHWFANCSSRQYQQTGSDGSTWVDMDATNLSVTFTPTVPSYAILSANSSLWTSAAGYNQDIGITVTGGAYPTAPGQPEAWKESGGPTTYAPDAAFVQTVIPVGAAATYTARLQWKANQPDPYTIWAGAGPIGANFSPTRITALLVPVSPTTVTSKSSTTQYPLTGNNGSTWVDMDPTNLSLSFAPPAGNWLAFVSGNADLWTTGGANQDIGIYLTGGAYPTTLGQPEAWKESGGTAAYSPNAAFVQAPLPVVGGGPTYTAKLQWKANHATSGTIWAGAGTPGKFSPTSLTVLLVPNPSGGAGISSTQQYPFPNSDGSTWTALDMANLKLTLAPSANTNYLLSANVDLWTNALTYGQDIGVMISGGAFGTGTLLAWQESGAAGTFSPNAAYTFVDVALAAGTSYTVWLVWKANHPAPGVTIYAAAGTAGKFSPTWLTATALN